MVAGPILSVTCNAMLGPTMRECFLIIKKLQLQHPPCQPFLYAYAIKKRRCTNRYNSLWRWIFLFHSLIVSTHVPSLDWYQYLVDHSAVTSFRFVIYWRKRYKKSFLQDLLWSSMVGPKEHITIWHRCIVYKSGQWQGNRLSDNAKYATIACWWNLRSASSRSHWTCFEVFLSYGKSCANIVCLVGDNCSVNQSMTRLLNVALLGCASHKFNLALQRWISEQLPVDLFQ